MGSCPNRPLWSKRNGKGEKAAAWGGGQCLWALRDGWRVSSQVKELVLSHLKVTAASTIWPCIIFPGVIYAVRGPPSHIFNWLMRGVRTNERLNLRYFPFVTISILFCKKAHSLSNCPKLRCSRKNAKAWKCFLSPLTHAVEGANSGKTWQSFFQTVPKSTVLCCKEPLWGWWRGWGI